MTSQSESQSKQNIRRRLTPVALSLILVAATTALLWLIEARLDQQHLIFIYFAPTAWIAIRYGSVSAMCVTVASSFAAAYFLYPPQLSFLIDSRLDILELILFGMLALLASKVVSGFANDELVIKRRVPTAGGRGWYDLAAPLRSIRTNRR